jgi:putative spermidine/putrescine transport system ATP-binding protein
MQVELKVLQREVGISFVFVTHDQEEAMVMSDRIALLRSGELEQVASPREIYSRPATSYVAQFIGYTNLLRCQIQNSIARCGPLSWPVSHMQGRAVFSLRPENIRVVSNVTGRSDPVSVRFTGRIRSRAFHGATELLQIECVDGLILTARVANSADATSADEFEFFANDAYPVRDSESKS